MDNKTIHEASLFDDVINSYYQNCIRSVLLFLSSSSSSFLTSGSLNFRPSAKCHVMVFTGVLKLLWISIKQVFLV